MPQTESNFMCDYKGCGREVHVGRYCDLHDPKTLEEERLSELAELDPEDAMSMVEDSSPDGEV